MTHKMISKQSAESPEVSLTERVRRITSAALVAGTLLVGAASAQAAIPRQSSVVARAVAVQDVLKEKFATTDETSAQKFPRAQALLAQWVDWGNWNNWVNWNNWNNWANAWSNWVNY